MEITVVSGRTPWRTGTLPAAVLRLDNWDDYGFKTMYDLIVYPDGETPIEVGQVRVLELGQSEGRPGIPSSFESLGPEFVSLG